MPIAGYSKCKGQIKWEVWCASLNCNKRSKANTAPATVNNLLSAYKSDTSLKICIHGVAEGASVEILCFTSRPGPAHYSRFPSLIPFWIEEKLCLSKLLH
jgi:hypothetical protein